MYSFLLPSLSCMADLKKPYHHSEPLSAGFDVPSFAPALPCRYAKSIWLFDFANLEWKEPLAFQLTASRAEQRSARTYGEGTGLFYSTNLVPVNTLYYR